MASNGRLYEAKPQLVLQGDYTFTDRELHDVLGFLELVNGSGAKHGEFVGARSMQESFNVGTLDEKGEYVRRPTTLPPPSAGLQFQPRLPAYLQGPLPAHLHQQQQQALSVAMPELLQHGGQQGLYQLQHQVPAQLRGPSQLYSSIGMSTGKLQEQHQVHMAAGSGNTTGNNIGPEQMGAQVSQINGVPTVAQLQHRADVGQVERLSAPCDSEDDPGKISHGASEKQRRDRINKMIDQLRKLVPPGGGGHGTATEGSPASIIQGKRSKYAVLAETIQFITLQNNQMKEKEDELAMLRACKIRMDQAGEREQQREQQPPSSRSHVPPRRHTFPTIDEGGENFKEALDLRHQMAAAKLPGLSDMDRRTTLSGGQSYTTPSRLDDSENDSLTSNLPGTLFSGSKGDLNIVIDKGNDHCYIRVSCLDRQGLLGDIMAALGALPLEVKRAAITTDERNVVTDIFQVELESGVDMSAEELQNALLQNLASNDDLRSDQRKRKKASFGNSTQFQPRVDPTEQQQQQQSVDVIDDEEMLTVERTTHPLHLL